MDPGRRVAAMVVDNASPRFMLPVYLHFPAWYQATHGGVVDFNFAEFHPQMVRYRPGVGPRISETGVWYPTAFEWDRSGGDRYDYFVVKSPVDASAAIFKGRRSSVELVTQSGWWWLYRKVGIELPRAMVAVMLPRSPRVVVPARRPPRGFLREALEAPTV